jgi:large conductance mechanosensitive channel
MGIVQEFRDFAMKGNVVDMAVGIVIGGAFGKIVGALVESVIMPSVGMLGNVDFTGLSLHVGNATIGYGVFLTRVVDFLIVACALFFVVRAMNQLARKPAAPLPPPAPTAQEKLLIEIRDLLKAR